MNMNLTDEKDALGKLLNTSNYGYEFKQINKNSSSYFLEYRDSPHSSEAVEVFDSERIVQIQKKLKDLWKDESGMGTVEVILIIVVLIGLVLIFKKQITQVVNNIFDKIVKQSNSV